MTYAAKTTVPVDQTIVEIRKTATKHGCMQFMFGVTDDRIIVGFTKEGRQVRFQATQKMGNEQRNRSVARALLLVLKAKLEAVASGIVVFEDEFLANIVLPDGALVGQQVRGSIAKAYETREMPPLLPDYSAEPGL